MTILCTGGAGYIGSHTCVELLKAGHDVIIVDNLYNSNPNVLGRIEEITGKKVKFYEADVRDEKAVSPIFEENKIDAIIHFAAYKAVGESVAKPVEYYRNNIDCTLTMLEAMKKYDVRRFIFSSSATVYGIPDHMPLDETMPTSATNPYGWTKYMNERILTDAAKANPEWSIVLLRYFNPIGAHETGRIGEMPNGIPNNLFPYILQVALGKLPYLHVYGNDYPTPDGTGVRDYIHVCDLAAGHLQAIAKIKTAGVHTYNLGTGQGYSVLDVLHAFEKAAGREIPYQIKPRRAGDIAACYADPSHAEKDLAWHAKYDLDAMARDLWRFYSQNPHGYEEK